jgi:valyl-tRNA synthetase
MPLDATDKWILTKLNHTVREMTDNLEEFELGLAAQKVYDFIWSAFCDWYIEFSKSRLYGSDAGDKQTAASVLVYVLCAALKLLHPFMPFVTEAIWKHLPGDSGSIIVASWPEAREIPASQSDMDAVEKTMEIITTIRTIRSDMKVPATRRPTLMIAAATGNTEMLIAMERHVLALAGLSLMELLPEGNAVPKGTMSAVCEAGMLYLPLDELIDVAQEIARAEKELAIFARDMASLEGKLANESFTAKAPAAVVEAERQRLGTIKEKLERVGGRIKELKDIG